MGGDCRTVAQEAMLPYDPIPWLMEQDGLPAARARRLLGLRCEGDSEAVRSLMLELSRAQSQSGSFAGSPIKTAGVLNLLDDLGAIGSQGLVAAGVSYLISVLESQPGHQEAGDLKPGSLRTPCYLGGFFGPYDLRGRPEVLARGAQEMNSFREFEPLLGPKTPVRSVPRSSRDGVGPGSCYAWGLIPLSYTVEAICRAGHADDGRVQPAINALLGAQRGSGGWCRNLGGHPSCTLHAIRVLGSHPVLRRGEHARRALEFMRSSRGKFSPFAALQAFAAFDLPAAQDMIRGALTALAGRQRKNGTFGGPCRVERVAAVLVALGAATSGRPRGTT